MTARRWFALAAAWAAVIYSTLYVARPVAEFLRERNLLRLAIWSIILGAGVVVVVWVYRRRPGIRGWGAIALGALLFSAGVSIVFPVEVKLHFVQYGVLGALLYSGFLAAGTRLAAVWAIVWTSLAGWLDEGIQYLLPNRWYDVEDVQINALAGAIAVLTMLLFRLDQRRPAAPDAPPTR